MTVVLSYSQWDIVHYIRADPQGTRVGAVDVNDVGLDATIRTIGYHEPMEQ